MAKFCQKFANANFLCGDEGGGSYGPRGTGLRAGAVALASAKSKRRFCRRFFGAQFSASKLKKRVYLVDA